jgi:hypothetical protein
MGVKGRSLSALARKITGTAWSRPLFFGLKAKRPANRRSMQPAYPTGDTAFSGAHHAADAKPGRTQFAPISGCLSPPQFWGAVIARTCRRSSHTAMILASKSRSHGYSFVERKRPVPCRRPIWR